ncbi:MAG: DegT/DnrJ/EryC1/StrS family aminotransferase [Smithella sp.]|jgi:dTDP-4-amino-4,6-dideoxygalactose transaminase
MSGSNPSIPLFDLNYGQEEEEAVQRVLRSKWLTMGQETEALEKEFAEFCGVKHAIAVSNCTTALHLANLAVGVKQGDEVICPSLTFVATSNSVIYAGGTPVFADINSTDDWTISPHEIEKKINKNTRAIIVMHYGGFACDMDKIMQIAARHSLPVIEDAAHAPGAAYKGRPLGSRGDISCFSFFSNKNISTGEGGMICTGNDDYAGKIRLMRSHAMTSLTLDRHKGHAYSYDVVSLGYNYRLDEIHAALARVQLKKLESGNEHRRAAATRYKSELSKIDRIRIPFADYAFLANYHIFPVLLDDNIDRKALMKYLRDKGIQTSIHYPPVHQFSFYKNFDIKYDLPLTEYVGQHEVTLPMYSSITGYQLDSVINFLLKYFEK